MRGRHLLPPISGIEAGARGETMMTRFTPVGRRAALLALAGVLVARGALATPDSTREWLAGLAKGTPKEGKVTLKAPEIAENGNAVPLTVSVESEMSEKSYVKAIYIAADGNPNPGVAVFEMTPRSGKAEISLRVRLQQTEKIVAVA